VVVVADPYPDDQGVVEADEPGVPVILRRASLAGCKALQFRFTSGPMINDALQQLYQLGLIASQAVLRSVAIYGDVARVVLRLDCRDTPWVTGAFPARTAA